MSDMYTHIHILIVIRCNTYMFLYRSTAMETTASSLTAKIYCWAPAASNRCFKPWFPGCPMNISLTQPGQPHLKKKKLRFWQTGWWFQPL